MMLLTAIVCGRTKWSSAVMEDTMFFRISIAAKMNAIANPKKVMNCAIELAALGLVREFPKRVFTSAGVTLIAAIINDAAIDRIRAITPQIILTRDVSIDVKIVPRVPPTPRSNTYQSPPFGKLSKKIAARP